MNKMIIMRGLPGCGKSTLAKKILKDFVEENEGKVRATILSTDDIVSTIVNDEWPEYLWAPDMVSESHYVNQVKCEQCCYKRFDLIIIDNTNITWRQVRPYVEIALDYGYEVDVIEPETPWERKAEVLAEKTLHGVPKESIQRMLNRWESTEDILKKIDGIKGMAKKLFPNGQHIDNGAFGLGPGVIL